jgi:pimeloyl-ACP methyl ester carboxylesterase
MKDRYRLRSERTCSMRPFTTLTIAVIAWTQLAIGPGRAISQCHAAPAGVTGLWMGTLKSLRIAFEVTEAPESRYTAVIHSIDQGAMNVPLTTVTVNGGNLRLELKSVFVYEGTLRTDGKAIEGCWIQGEPTPLVVQRIDRLPDLTRPQDPKKPYPYAEEEVTYENRQAGVTLAGTLTIPEGTGPFPAVVLLSGSGPQNRNEELFNHRPFLVLADHLTRQGIAVLRADDRGVGGSTGDFSKATTADFAEDGLAGVEFLKGRREIQSDRIGLIGHSEGGMMAPLAATRSSDVAFIVMLAGPGQRLAEVVTFQILRGAKSEGADESLCELRRSWCERLYALLAEDTDDATAAERIRALHATLTTEEKERLDWTDAKLDDRIRSQLKPWWRYAMQYDPRATLMKVRCPVLALNGERDMQVVAKDNIAAVSEALRAGGNTQSTVLEIPGVNHAFQTAGPGMELEYAKIEETIAPVVLRTISDWIVARTADAGRGP